MQWMKAQFVFLLQLLQEHQDELVIVYFCLAALSLKYWLKLHPNFMSAILIGTVAMLAVVTILAYISEIILYLLYPNYFDHALPQVASISWLRIRGHELYPDLTTGDVYFPIYGPLTYLLNGIMLFVGGPSIFVSKLPGVLSLAVALVATLIILQ